LTTRSSTTTESPSTVFRANRPILHLAGSRMS
jgi:hypothetical protein